MRITKPRELSGARDGSVPPSRCAAVVAAVALATGVVSRPPPACAQDGKALFEGRCAACHSLGTDRLIGPGLQGVTARRERAWLLRWITAPDRVLAERDSIATRLLAEYNSVPMPNFGLSRAEAEAVLAYVEKPGRSAPASGATAAARAAPLPPGDPILGKGLFTGALRFHNGAPACMACHSVAGIGALGGGALGPDLTAARAKYGAAGLATVLATTPFPTMQPIFSARPLTPEEQGHVGAFLAQPVAMRPRGAVGLLAMLALLGAVVLVVPMQAIWRRRLRSVRRPLVEGSRSRHVD